MTCQNLGWEKCCFADVAEQWQKFILEPLSQLAGPLSRNVVVVIDALDESGAEATRQDILDILAARDAQLPANIRIVLTSRPIMDIRQTLPVNMFRRDPSMISKPSQ